jgi:hypothetical protein
MQLVCSGLVPNGSENQKWIFVPYVLPPFYISDSTTYPSIVQRSDSEVLVRDSIMLLQVSPSMHPPRFYTPMGHIVPDPLPMRQLGSAG